MVGGKEGACEVIGREEETRQRRLMLGHVQQMVREVLAHEDWSYRKLGRACEVYHGAVQGWAAGESLPNAASYELLKAIHRRVKRA
jgi:DNA-binding transcriptional regulator YiaG